jgi:predicted dehydrogenase
MHKALNFGVVGTGSIAASFAEALRRSQRCRVVNVVGSSPQKGKGFAQRWSIPNASATLKEMLVDPGVEAVYIATPHPLHETQAIQSLTAGKPVLCEKPLATDAAGAARIIEQARSSNVFLMEAYMYLCHPLVRALLARLHDGVIGPLRYLEADFAFRVPRDLRGRLFDLSLGGGSILDVGGYPVTFARLMAGIVEQCPFAEPVKLQAAGLIGPSGADELATAVLTFASGFSAKLTAATRYDVGTTTVIYGEDGKIVLDNPWIPRGDRQCLETAFTLFRDGRDSEVVSVRTELATYALEAELVADTLPAFEPAWPALGWEDTLKTLRVLDDWQAALRRESES